MTTAFESLLENIGGGNTKPSTNTFNFAFTRGGLPLKQTLKFKGRGALKGYEMSCQLSNVLPYNMRYVWRNLAKNVGKNDKGYDVWESMPLSERPHNGFVAIEKISGIVRFILWEGVFKFTLPKDKGGFSYTEYGKYDESLAVTGLNREMFAERLTNDCVLVGDYETFIIYGLPKGKELSWIDNVTIKAQPVKPDVKPVSQPIEPVNTQPTQPDVKPIAQPTEPVSQLETIDTRFNAIEVNQAQTAQALAQLAQAMQALIVSLNTPKQ